MSINTRDAGFAVAEVESSPPVRMGILGTGRIGRMHAGLLAREVPGTAIAVVSDVNASVAAHVGEGLGVPSASIESVLGSSDVDAVAICTSTDTHVDLIVAAAQAGKAIFCEKPISLDIAQVDRALAAVEQAGVPFMVGFNRRFDPGHASVYEAVRRGDVGDLHTVHITSRDPAPPPPEYVAVSGGIFLDMTIHDFDMARHVVGSEVVEVFARGAVRIDPRIGEAGDVDTAVTILTHADGTLTTIENSRQAVYGFDQRIEAFGSAGAAVSGNPARHAGYVIGTEHTRSQPLPHFFLDRYLESYRLEWAAFAAYVRGGGPSPVDIESGRAPVLIGIAATRSLREGRPVTIAEVL
nr:inositol 2-dehydrogenase [Rhodococcus sp. (in: high G+C Gram-positive bacteria)]